MTKCNCCLKLFLIVKRVLHFSKWISHFAIPYPVFTRQTVSNYKIWSQVDKARISSVIKKPHSQQRIILPLRLYYNMCMSVLTEECNQLRETLNLTSWQHKWFGLLACKPICCHVAGFCITKKPVTNRLQNAESLSGILCSTACYTTFKLWKQIINVFIRRKLQK